MSDYLYSFFFVTALAFPLVFFPVMFRKWKKAGAILLGIYLLSYLPFTFMGSFAVVNHGGNHWTREWLPRFLMEKYQAPSGRPRADLTIAGAAFWPCLLLDRHIWHRTVRDELVNLS